MRINTQTNHIEEVPLERYVLGVLSQEVPADWPLEALKAQAIASRTYALYRKDHPRNDRYDVAADTSDQVFQLKRHYPEATIQAVEQTEGETLTFDGHLIPAFFHSCCGGVTEQAGFVPFVKNIDDPFCDACPRYHWEFLIPSNELGPLLQANGFPTEGDWTLEVGERDESGRVSHLTLFSSGKVSAIPATDFRKIVGNTKIRSALFDLIKEGTDYHFTGKGAGHGVGLCQWGAKGMADRGYTDREILEFYYPGTEISSPMQPESRSADPD